jgi:hypothetical protein
VRCQLRLICPSTLPVDLPLPVGRMAASPFPVIAHGVEYFALPVLVSYLFLFGRTHTTKCASNCGTVGVANTIPFHLANQFIYGA